MDLTFEVRQYIRDNMRKATFMEMAELLKCDPYWLIDQLRPTPTVKRGRMWSPEDDMQLLSLFGQNDFETIAEQTGRTVDALKNRLRQLLHMEDFHKGQDYLLLKEFGDLAGMKRGRMVGTFRNKYGLPIHEKGITDKPIFVIKRDEGIQWLKDHPNLYNGLHVSEALFPEGFPQWMLEKRERDRQDQSELAAWAKDPLTAEQEQAILALHNLRVPPRKISAQLQVEPDVVHRYLIRKGDRNWHWKEEELQYIRDNWKTQTDQEMAEHLHRHFISVRVARLDMDLVRRKRIKRYTEKEKKYLREHYQTMTDSQLAKKLGRTTNSIAARRAKDGLVKTAKKTEEGLP